MVVNLSTALQSDTQPEGGAVLRFQFCTSRVGRPDDNVRKAWPRQRHLTQAPSGTEGVVTGQLVRASRIFSNICGLPVSRVHQRVCTTPTNL
jgi:hypothetical protein